MVQESSQISINGPGAGGGRGEGEGVLINREYGDEVYENKKKRLLTSIEALTELVNDTKILLLNTSSQI